MAVLFLPFRIEDEAVWKLRMKFDRADGALYFDGPSDTTVSLYSDCFQEPKLCFAPTIHFCCDLKYKSSNINFVSAFIIFKSEA